MNLLLSNLLFFGILFLVFIVIAFLFYNPPSWLESWILYFHLDKTRSQLKVINYSRSQSPIASWIRTARDYSEQFENAVDKINREKKEKDRSF